MRLTFLGKNTQGGGSPSLFSTDRDSYVVQGWKVPHQPDLVEIPAGLLRYLLPGTELDVPLRSTGKLWRDDHGEDWRTFVLTGAMVSDPAALAQLTIPDHETCVEVGLRRKGDDSAAAAGRRI
jgi:hypothetical protein